MVRIFKNIGIGLFADGDLPMFQLAPMVPMFDVRCVHWPNSSILIDMLLYKLVHWQKHLDCKPVEFATIFFSAGVGNLTYLIMPKNQLCN